MFYVRAADDRVMRTDVPAPTSPIQRRQAGDEPVAWLLEREVRPPDVVVEFMVLGDPKSKSRPRLGRGHTYTPAETVTAERVMALAARQAGVRVVEEYQSFGLMAVFFTASWQRRDVDNMVKLVADALTGVVWVDDSQVTEMSARVVRATPDPRTHVQIYRTLQQSPAQRQCAVCEVKYRAYASWTDRKYCSRACTVTAATQRVVLACVGCGGDVAYTVSGAARVKLPFCSRTCQQATQAPELSCDYCKATFRKPRSQRSGQFVYCSRTCSSAASRGRPRPVVTGLA